MVAYPEGRVIARQTGKTGWGLFATVDFDEGDEIIFLSLTADEHSQVIPWNESFDECYDRGLTIFPNFALCCTQGHPFWNMNHSCNSNCSFTDWGRVKHNRIPIVATHKIRAGEQLTLDYPLFTAVYDGSLDGDAWEMKCLCGEPNCRGSISGFDRLPFELQQQALLNRQVFAHMVHDLPVLEDWLAQHHAQLYADYLSALQQQLELSARWAGR